MSVTDALSLRHEWNSKLTQNECAVKRERCLEVTFFISCKRHVSSAMAESKNYFSWAV